MKKRMTYSKQSEAYLKKMIAQFEDNKLTKREIYLLFQDLVDTGLVWTLGGQYSDLANKMIKSNLILPAPSGYKGVEFAVKPPKVLN